MAVKAKRRHSLQVLVAVAVALLGYWFYGGISGSLKPQPAQVPTGGFNSLRDRLRNLRTMLAGDLNRDDLYKNGYMSLLVGWSMMKSAGKASIDSMIDTALTDNVPEYVMFFSGDEPTSQVEGFHGFDTNANTENYKIWKLVAPKGCKETLPLYLNLHTGSFLCGHSTDDEIDRWRLGLPKTLAKGDEDVLVVEQEVRTVKDWLRHVYGNSRAR